MTTPADERAEVRFETGTGMERKVLETVPGDWPAYYQNVADHLLRGEELAVKPEEGRRTVAVIEMAAESAARGEIVNCRI